MRLRILVLLVFALTVLLAGDQPGVPVRAANEYAAHLTVDGVTLAAGVVPAEKVKKLFSKDLDHAGYIVVEVAVIPDSGITADFATGEFTLKVGTDATILTALSARSVAGGEKPRPPSTHQPSPLPDNVHVYQSTTIGYESGGYGRKGGVYTGTSTTVAVGDRPGYDPRCDPTVNNPTGDPRTGRIPPGCMPPPGPSSQKQPPDQSELRQELEDKSLPEGKTGAPVAGYLYFARPSTKQKNPAYQLTWYRVAGEAKLTLPPPK